MWSETRRRFACGSLLVMASPFGPEVRTNAFGFHSIKEPTGPVENKTIGNCLEHQKKAQRTNQQLPEEGEPGTNVPKEPVMDEEPPMQPGPKNGKQVYAPDDLKFEHPLHGGRFPKERSTAEAEAEALRAAEQPKQGKPKANTKEGRSSRLGCAQNNYLN